MPGFRAGRINNDNTSSKRRRHTPDQIIRKLAEGNKLLASGQELDEVCRHLEIAESTWHRWLTQYGGTKANDAKRLEAHTPTSLSRNKQSPAPHHPQQPPADTGLPTPCSPSSTTCNYAESIKPTPASNKHHTHRLGINAASA